MSGISSGGLVSGLDTNSIISQLVAVEQAKVTREETKKAQVESAKEKFSSLQTMLVNLADKAAALDEEKDFNVFQTLSNNDEYAVVSGGSDAVDGQYEVVVNQLATTQKVASNSFNTVNTSLNWSGEFSISTSKAAQDADHTKTTVNVAISSTDTLKDVAKKINAADGAGVRASIMSLANGENRLVLTAVDEGTEGFFLKGVSGDDLLGTDRLGILDTRQSAKSENAFVTLTGNAATTATKFSELSTGLTVNNLDLGTATTVGDKIKFSVTNALGTTYANTEFELKENGTVQDLIDKIGQIANTGIADPANWHTQVSLNSSGEIILSSKDGAQTSAISLDMELVESAEPGAQASSLALGGSIARNNYLHTLNEAQNAFYTLDGMAITSQSNQDDSTVTGTTFTLKKADPSVTVKLSLSSDTSAIADKISAFVEEYNAVMKFLDENSKVTVKEETGDDGKKKTTRTKGPFAGDSNISSLRNQLQRMMTYPIDELNSVTQYSSLSRIGITTGKDGYMTVDDDDLSKALENDLDGVRRLFAVSGYSSQPGYSLGRYTDDTKTGTYYVDVNGSIFGSSPDGTWSATDTGDLFGNIFTSNTGSSKGLSLEVPFPATGTTNFTFVRGVANQFSLFVEQSQDFVDGFFKATEDIYEKRIENFDERIETLQRRVDTYEQRLIKQFTSLESSLSKLQSQTSNMLAQLST